MAASFGVSTDFLDRELAEFIVAGRLTAKIDKVAGIVETNRWASFREPCMPGMLVCTQESLLGVARLGALKLPPMLQA